FFFFSSRRRHTRWPRDWSSDVCSSDLRFGFFSERDRSRSREALQFSARQRKQRRLQGGFRHATTTVRDRLSPSFRSARSTRRAFVEKSVPIWQSDCRS